MAWEFWLDDRQWAAIEPLLPTNQPGAHRKDDRRIISGIIHVLKAGGRWQDCPAVYGPPTTIYNRFHRGRDAGFGGNCLPHWRSRRHSDDRQHPLPRHIARRPAEMYGPPRRQAGPSSFRDLGSVLN